MRNLIVPISGKSSRFPNMEPKWMLRNPNGKMMLVDSLCGMKLDFFDKIFITMLKQHEDQYNISKYLTDEISKLTKKNNVFITYLSEETKSQPETIYKTIINNDIKGFIGIKDSDNYFDFKPLEENSISVFDLHNTKSINPGNKSYIITDSNNYVINIAEKDIISNWFCSGYYSFVNSSDFIFYYNQLKDYESLYVSHIIMKMIIDNKKFIPIECSHYIDWGTKQDWLNYKNQFKTIFCELEGTVFKNETEHSSYNPIFFPIQENVDTLKKLYKTGKVQIIFFTSTPSLFKSKIINILSELGIEYFDILFDVFDTKKVMINQFSNSNPYPNGEVINIDRGRNIDEFLN